MLTQLTRHSEDNRRYVNRRQVVFQLVELHSKLVLRPNAKNNAGVVRSTGVHPDPSTVIVFMEVQSSERTYTMPMRKGSS